MFLDASLMFSKEQAITETTVSNALLLSQNSKRLTSAGIQTGASDIAYKHNGTPLYPFVQITEEFEGLTSFIVEVQKCNDESYDPTVTGAIMPADAEWNSVISSEKYTLDDLNTLGLLHLEPVSASGVLRLRYVVEGSVSAGSVSAGLVLNIQS